MGEAAPGERGAAVPAAPGTAANDAAAAPEPANGRTEPTLRLAAAVLLPYWRKGPQRREAFLLTFALVALLVVQVLIQVQLNLWTNTFFNALDQRHAGEVLRLVSVFGLLALGAMAVAAWLLYVRMALQLGWRRWLTHRLVERWLANGAHYRLRFMGSEYDNPDFRITENARISTEAAVEFAGGLLNSAMLLIAFLGILWGLSGGMHVRVFGHDYGIPGYLVIAAVLYAAVGSAVTFWIGRPLIGINEERHAREGDFRYGLVRVRENAEGIAFLRGEHAEAARLHALFDAAARVWRRQIVRTRKLTWVTSGYATAATVVPLLIAAPQYLGGALTLGGLMQAAFAFVQVQTALSWLVDNFAKISEWRAAVNRVAELDETAGRLAEGPPADAADRIALADSADGVLRLDDVHVAEPDGSVIIDHATAEIRPGEKVLVTGAPGVGKEALMRAIAGLWPWGKGRIELPAGSRMAFVSPTPYLPPGPLAAAIAYPEPPDRFTPDEIAAALRRCRLDDHVASLAEAANWGDALPQPILQQMGFARLLLVKPDWVFLNEAASALDDDTLAAVMGLFREELAATTLMTFGAGERLVPFHDRTLTLMRSEEGTRLVGWVPRLAWLGEGGGRGWLRAALRRALARLRRT